MIINQVIIHELIKKAGEQPTIVPANDLLDVADNLVIKLVDELNKLYGTKGNNAIYGTFTRTDETNEFPKFTDEYLNEESNENFLGLSKRCMAELAREASAKPTATGGYIVFTRYKEQEDFLLVAMIKDKQGLKVDENLKPVSVTSIDLSKIHQAARINLSKYKSDSVATTEDENDEETKSYLSFVSPRTNNDVSGYFIKALDCADGVPAARATKAAFSAVDDYFRSKSELKPFRAKARDYLIEYFENCLKDGKPATLEGAEHAIRKATPTEYHELINDFSEFANSETHQVPEAFGVNKAKITEYIRIRAKTPNWELNFARKAVGTDENSELCYREDSGTLIIRCTDELKEKIEATLSEKSNAS